MVHVGLDRIIVLVVQLQFIISFATSNLTNNYLILKILFLSIKFNLIDININMDVFSISKICFHLSGFVSDRLLSCIRDLVLKWYSCVCVKQICGGGWINQTLNDSCFFKTGIYLFLIIHLKTGIVYNIICLRFDQTIKVSHWLNILLSFCLLNTILCMCYTNTTFIFFIYVIINFFTLRLQSFYTIKKLIRN